MREGAWMSRKAPGLHFTTLNLIHNEREVGVSGIIYSTKPGRECEREGEGGISGNVFNEHQPHVIFVKP